MIIVLIHVDKSYFQRLRIVKIYGLVRKTLEITIALLPIVRSCCSGWRVRSTSWLPFGRRFNPVEVARIGAATGREETVSSELEYHTKQGERYWIERELKPFADGRPATPGTSWQRSASACRSMTSAPATRTRPT
jgi:hypothetical protein